MQTSMQVQKSALSSSSSVRSSRAALVAQPRLPHLRCGLDKSAAWDAAFAPPQFHLQSIRLESRLVQKRLHACSVLDSAHCCAGHRPVRQLPFNTTRPFVAAIIVGISRSISLTTYPYVFQASPPQPGGAGEGRQRLRRREGWVAMHCMPMYGMLLCTAPLDDPVQRPPRCWLLSISRPPATSSACALSVNGWCCIACQWHAAVHRPIGRSSAAPASLLGCLSISKSCDQLRMCAHL